MSQWLDFRSRGKMSATAAAFVCFGMIPFSGMGLVPSPAASRGAVVPVVGASLVRPASVG